MQKLIDIANTLTFQYQYKIGMVRKRTFGLPEDRVGTPEWQARRFLTNIMLGKTREEAVLRASYDIFKEYKSVKAIAAADSTVIFNIMRRNYIEFAENKTPNMIEAARRLSNDFHGYVPANRKALQSFRGVGYHIASIVLALAFDQPEFGVDLHVRRVMSRLGIFPRNTSDIEMARIVKDVLPANQVGNFSRSFVDFGKRVCGKTPKCKDCPLAAKCARSGKMARIPEPQQLILFDERVA